MINWEGNFAKLSLGDKYQTLASALLRKYLGLNQGWAGQPFLPRGKAGQGKKTRGGGAKERVNKELLSGFLEVFFVKGNFSKRYLFYFATPVPCSKNISKGMAGQGRVDWARKDGVEHGRGGSAYSSKQWRCVHP